METPEAQADMIRRAPTNSHHIVFVQHAKAVVDYGIRTRTATLTELQHSPVQNKLVYAETTGIRR